MYRQTNVAITYDVHCMHKWFADILDNINCNSQITLTIKILL